MTNHHFMSAVTCYVSFYFFITLCLANTSNILYLDEGEVCRKGEGLESDYVCKKPKNCETFKKMIENGYNPVVCSFEKFQPIVCCPTVTRIETTIIPDAKVKNSNRADKMCRRYSELEYPDSEMFHIEVVGGKEARPQEFPHMAILGYGETAEQGKWGCGGSIISESWILTAAHCLANSWGNARWARVGDLNIVSTSDAAEPKDYRIVQHVLHPDYRRSSHYHDVALFRLEKKIAFSAYARPICLNTDPSLTPPKQIATGWGRTGLGEATSDVLLSVQLDVVTPRQCNSSYYSEDDTRLRYGITPDSMICAGSSEGDKDTCVGDSGGPLQTRNAENPKTYIQFGITSFGRFCGDKTTPGVYTRVSKYVPWIERIVWPTTS